jgi:hypothetical protein
MSFFAFLAALTAAGLAAGVALAGTTGSACARVRSEARTGTPEQVMFLFVRTGVLRVDPACAYDLVTARFRKKATRATFAAGKAHIAPYRTKRPTDVLADYVPRTRLPDQAGSWITLDAPDLKPRTFEIVLQKRNGRWLVDYWAVAVGFN